jgi:hypothetical protein
MTKFLTIKHWQLFVLLVGIPMIAEFVIMGAVLTNRDLRIAFTLLPVLMILSLGLFYGWFYSLGTNLFKRLP